MKNYWKLSVFSLFRDYYLFVDVPEHEAASIFRRRGVRLSKTKEAMSDRYPFRVIMCGVPRKQSKDFCRAMEELPKKMLICGYRNYPDYCRTVSEMLGLEDDGNDEAEEAKYVS